MFELFKALLGSNSTSQNLLVQARNSFLEMLDLGTELLTEVTPHLLDKSAPEDLLEQARSIDKTTNRLERSIRKLLVEHLAFSTADAPACLVLMSVAKDGERLIDECRNLIDVCTLIKTPISDDYRTNLQELAKDLQTVMKDTREAFADNDERKALNLVEGEKPFFAKVRATGDEVLDDEQLTARQGVVINRSFRTLQRIRAHLGNIASTVVFPVHRIDFVKGTFIKAAKERLG